MLKSLALSVALLAVASTSLAQVTQPLPPALAAASKTGMKVEKSFPAVSGLTGWLLNRDGDYSIVYSTADNQTILNGALITADGRNMTPVYTEQHVPKPDYDGLWASLEAASTITEGASGPNTKAVVYAFLDTNCIFCHLAWKALAPYHRAGLQVRWVPVAFLKANSVTQAAYIMQSADPAAALQKHENAYKAGGIDPQGVKVTDATRKALDSNSKLMKAFGFNGTPALVYKDATGKVIAKNGMPRLSELPTILNLPRIPNTDPELARFE
jgi:thiol:disulfide interchange protein DsbG